MHPALNAKSQGASSSRLLDLERHAAQDADFGEQCLAERGALICILRVEGRNDSADEIGANKGREDRIKEANLT